MENKSTLLAHGEHAKVVNIKTPTNILTQPKADMITNEFIKPAQTNHLDDEDDEDNFFQELADNFLLFLQNPTDKSVNEQQVVWVIALSLLCLLIIREFM